jgi:hypothetical protein
MSNSCSNILNALYMCFLYVALIGRTSRQFYHFNEKYCWHFRSVLVDLFPLRKIYQNSPLHASDSPNPWQATEEGLNFLIMLRILV